MPGHAQATYVLGHLVFPRGDQLYAQPFDLKTGTVSGIASPLGVQVYRGGASGGTFTFAVGGRTLVSVAGVVSSRSRFVAFDRQGRAAGEFGQPAEWAAFDLSASGDRLVVNASGSSSSLWVLEKGRAEPRRLTFDDRADVDPNLAADGTVYFVRRTGAAGGLYRISIEGGAESRVGSGPSFQSLDDVADDGSRIVYRKAAFNTEALVNDRTGATERVLVRARANVDQVHLAPDGLWVAYNSAETGRQEVYIASATDMTARWLVSSAGGVQPVWSADGRSLYYLGLEGTVYSAPVDADDRRVRPGTPPALFRSPLTAPNPTIEQFRVSAR